MTVTLIPVPGLPEITAGADLAQLIADAIEVQDGDIVVVTSKVVSKAQGRFVPADDRQALVLQQSHAVVAERATPTGFTRIVHALAGPVMTGAGIDASNSDDLLLLPEDPDAAADQLRAGLARRTGVRLGVLLSDTSGRPWRDGLTDFALGTSGLTGLEDLRGLADTHGRDLAVTVRNLADEIASAADLVKGKLDRVPVAIVRGLAHLVTDEHGGSAALLRTGPQDFFALGQREAVRDALGIAPGSEVSMRVGLASVLPEERAQVLARAVRTAVHGAPDVTEPTVDDDRITVPLRTPQDGYLLARLEVALRGERLTITIRREPDRAVISVAD